MNEFLKLINLLYYFCCSFGESNGTTPRLPLEAQGDRELVERLSKLPIDKQPFWFINWQALEAQRQNPQTYPQKPNSFIDNIPSSGANTNQQVQNNPSAANSFNSAGPSSDINVRFSGNNFDILSNNTSSARPITKDSLDTSSPKNKSPVSTANSSFEKSGGAELETSTGKKELKNTNKNIAKVQTNNVKIPEFINYSGESESLEDLTSSESADFGKTKDRLIG